MLVDHLMVYPIKSGRNVFQDKVSVLSTGFKYDRFTDLITIRKDLGRKLAGKQVHVITTSSGDHLAEQFWLPFQKTCDYLNMEFKGGYHFKNTIPLDLEIENFIKESKLNVEL